MSTRLYVGNLPKQNIERDELQSVFAEAGTQVSTKVIKDRKTGKCRGFAFITVPNDEVANELIEKHNGETFMDSPLKIEIAQPRAKSKPTSNKGESPSPSSSPSNNRRSDRNKKQSSNNSSSTGSSSVQPDPRWASELAQIKELLATQASNS
ncbi:MAG: RNA-binding protein [Jaaginema sp. PMC 1079.18]|nr:RNA-binding protein [Jaaginema sp. PMC 1080.18]MEC4853005.1 RNA-binding protein [Jaaginema sp. PMC 1079.18]MEC4868528.1 RNA-binding protein [Jaaginema sp. PMC 1078.18]